MASLVGGEQRQLLARQGGQEASEMVEMGVALSQIKFPRDPSIT